MNAVTAAMPPWMLRLVAPRAQMPVASTTMPSRIEVRPPELWPSSIGWRACLRRWLQHSRWVPARVRPAYRLAQVRREFRAATADLPLRLLGGLDERIERARSLREFWHLRSPLYNALALGLDQLEAERRLAQLNRHFRTRTARAA